MSDRELTSRAGQPATTRHRLSEQLGYGAGWLVGALPLGMQGDDFLVRFLSIFEEVATTLRASADSIARVADVDVTSPEMVRYLGEWVTAPALDSRLALQKQRHIVHATGATIGHRGTAAALRAVLGAITGDAVDVVDEGGVYREGEAPKGPGTVTIRTTSAGHLRDGELVELILSSVPAHVQVVVECAGRTLYPDITSPSTSGGGQA
ncbi:MAG: phage tail protein [Ilumatobacteraceae bacterium]|nr:phage tail protein [Ilumatobacteraceae bacterium]